MPALGGDAVISGVCQHPVDSAGVKAIGSARRGSTTVPLLLHCTNAVNEPTRECWVKKNSFSATGGFGGFVWLTSVCSSSPIFWWVGCIPAFAAPRRDSITEPALDRRKDGLRVYGGDGGHLLHHSLPRCSLGERLAGGCSDGGGGI